MRRKESLRGLTCAACHTAHAVHGDTESVREGGPVMTDLGLLTQALGAAPAQTAFASKIPVVDARFERFAKRVLGSGEITNNVLTRATLKKELDATEARKVSVGVSALASSSAVFEGG